MKKLRVAVMSGGRSAEHEVSKWSAKNVIAAMDRRKYVIVPVAVSRTGRFDINKVMRADVVFPTLHGTGGEDGSLQGWLETVGKPYVGAGVLASAAGFDKDAAKRLLRDAGIAVAPSLTFLDPSEVRYAQVKRRLGMPVFVKPANQGSSVGVHKAGNAAQLKMAVRDAFRYDDKILVESAVKGREIECSVLGNRDPQASLPGEVVPKHEFYSYEAKYLDENGAALIVPAKLPARLVRKIQATALRTYRALGLEGMARVDVFLKGNGGIVVNEVNTLPGFTKISMYPKLWEASGLAYPKLIDALIGLALERHRRKRRLKTAYGARQA